MNTAPVWVLIPVKPLALSKSRLAAVLSPAERSALTAWLLDRLLRLLTFRPGVGRVVVVSRDPAVASLAHTSGAEVYPDEAPLDLNLALTDALRQALAQGAESVLILPSDLPFVTTDDLEQILQTSGRVTICPDRHAQGTNALLLRAPSGFTFHYGPGSFWRHIQEAEKLGWPVQPLFLEGLAFDLDTVEDWQLFQAQTPA